MAEMELEFISTRIFTLKEHFKFLKMSVLVDLDKRNAFIFKGIQLIPYPPQRKFQKLKTQQDK